MERIFFDKYGEEIQEKDTLVFNNGDIYKVVKKDNIFCIKCESKILPLFRMENLIIGNVFVSGCRKKR